MPSAKIFRDRVVSLEQTYEQGEKYLTLLRTLIEEAIPGITFREYYLDHERDTFVMVYVAEGGVEKRISWTRMVLYDAERIPAVAQDPSAPVRARFLGFLRANAGRPVIAVTFRHLEDGWVDTPEPKKQKPKPPREKGRPEPPRPQNRGREQPPARPQVRPPQQPSPAPAARVAPPQPGTPAPEGERPGGGRRRFRRRRRRGGRGKGGPAPGTAGPPS